MSRELPILFTGAMVRAILGGRKTETRRLVKPQPPSECSIHYALGNKSWLPQAERSPLRHTWEAWWGDLFEARPEGHLCGSHDVRCPYGAPGGLLWARETWGVFDRGSVDPFEVGEALPSPFTTEYALAYRATDEDPNTPATWVEAPSGHRILAADERWRPSIHMPKWACRLWLRVEDVRVERVQEITDDGAVAEGAQRFEAIPEGPLSERFAHLRWHDPSRWSMDSPATTDQCLASARMAFANAWDSMHGAGAFDRNDWVWVVSFSRTEAPQ